MQEQPSANNPQSMEEWGTEKVVRSGENCVAFSDHVFDLAGGVAAKN